MEVGGSSERDEEEFQLPLHTDRKEGGKPLCVASSREDRVAMATACSYWLASMESVEFIVCLNIWALHFLGRGREVSFLKAGDVGSADTNNQEIEYKVLGVNNQWDKTGLVQDLHLYPHTSMQSSMILTLLWSPESWSKGSKMLCFPTSSRKPSR